VEGYRVPKLRWVGKLANDGRSSPLDRVPIPLNSVEVAGAVSHDAEQAWLNRLLQGEARQVLTALQPEFAGRVRLIYIDPPFATGSDFALTRPVPAPRDHAAKPTTVLRLPAFRDAWEGGLDSYLQWFFELTVVLRQLLDPHGALLVHCDWRTSAPLRLLLDEVFGTENFRNEIIWAYRSGGASRTRALSRKHDTILLYARSPHFQVHAQTERQYLRKPFMGSRQDESGRYYVDTLLRDVLEGEITLMRDGAPVRYNLRPVLNLARERLGYPTQKPLGLLELLLEIASEPGDLVLDPCSGSGTFPVAAENAGRRWIACDASTVAIQTTRKRLLALPGIRQFVIQRLDSSITSAETQPAQPHAEQIVTLDVAPTVAGWCATLTLAGFAMPSNAVPPPVLAEISDWTQWVDTWSVDWDYRGPPFRATGHAARTRAQPHLPLTCNHTYAQAGAYVVAVRVTDICGGDTTTLVPTKID
jgi:DNA modification methylase